MPTPITAPATPAILARVSCAAPAEGLVDGAEVLAGTVTVVELKGAVNVEERTGAELEEGRLALSVGELLLIGTAVVKVVVSGGDTEVTVEVTVVTLDGVDEVTGVVADLVALLVAEDVAPDEAGKLEADVDDVDDEDAEHIPARIALTWDWSA